MKCYLWQRYSVLVKGCCYGSCEGVLKGMFFILVLFIAYPPVFWKIIWRLIIAFYQLVYNKAPCVSIKIGQPLVCSCRWDWRTSGCWEGTPRTGRSWQGGGDCGCFPRCGGAAGAGSVKTNLKGFLPIPWGIVTARPCCQREVSDEECDTWAKMRWERVRFPWGCPGTAARGFETAW